MANRLWEARKTISSLNKEIKQYKYIQSAAEVEAATLREKNYVWHKALKKNDITTHKLIVEHRDSYCGDNESEYGCYAVDCDGCENLCETRNVERISFYVWEVNNGELLGIKRNFEEAQLEVLRIIDETTGTVLYERKKDE